MSDARRFHRVTELFEMARAKDRADRHAFLVDACGDDAELRAEVERLLAHHDEDDGLLDAPIVPDAAYSRAHEVAASPEPPLPERIGQYRLHRRIGVGGMGIVYLAEQDRPRRDVAIKVIRPGLVTRELLKRFDLETAMLGRLQHPGIAQIYEAGTYDDGSGARPFFAMEFIDGAPLLEYVRGKALDVRQRLETLARICDAVEHAHQRGIIHRDLKPGNILVDRSGQPKILDFGVARATESDLQVSTLRTDVGQLVGTVAYMSPEQIEGTAAEIDTRSDVYALGIILYELVADRLPYDLGDRTLAAATRVITETEPTSLSSVNRSYRGDLDTIAARALEKEPDRRYASASELAADVRRFLNDEPIVARPATTLYQLRKFARRHRGLVGGVAAAFVALVAGVIVSVVFAIGQSRALAESEQQRLVADAVVEFLNREILAQGNPRRSDPRNRADRDVAANRDITLRTVIDRAAEKVGTQFADQPLVEASIRLTLGSTYESLGVYESAEEHHARALVLFREHAGDRAPETATALNGIGLAQMARGSYAEALASYRAVLASYVDFHGEEHEYALVAMFNVGGCLYRIGELDEGAAVLERAYAISRRALGDDHELTLRTTSALASIHLGRGRYDDAERMIEAALAGQEATLGRDHPDTLGTLSLRAQLLRRRHRLDEAQAAYEECIELLRRVAGADHGTTLSAMVGYATVLRDRRQLEEAERQFREVLERRQRLVGDDHPDTVSSKADIAFVLRRRGKHAEAEVLYRGIIPWRTDRLGPSHPKTLLSITGLADAVWRQNRLDEAETLYRQVLERRRTTLGDDHADTLVSMTGLGVLCYRQEKLDEAAKWLALALDGRRRVLGEDSRQTLWTLHNLAAVTLARGRYEDAEPLLREDLERQRRLHGEAHARTWTVVESLVRLYRETGRSNRAEAVLRETYDIRREQFGDEHELTVAAARALEGLRTP